MAFQQIPFKTDCTANTINIEWQGQRGQFNNYIVKYRAKDNKDVFAVKRTSESKIQISNLKNENMYEIKIFVEDTDGDESLLIKTEVRTLASIASMLLKSAEKICDYPVIYRLCPVKITNLPEGIQIREFFSDVNNKEERSLILLGVNSSGKSTLVDAFINYVTDVSFADNFRFKITDEITQEEDIVCYKIRCQDGFKVGFNINIIDVPGLKSGYNESIYKQLLALFQSVRCIGAACLVVPSFCRLTEEHRCIFNNILSIFGKDINYIIPLITFDDGGEINALSSLKDAKVPFVEHMQFRFNNSQLFSGKEHVEIWNRRQITMNNLFGEPTVFVNCSVELTKEVLKSRITLKQLFDDAKQHIGQIERRKTILKEYDLRKGRQQIRSSVGTISHANKICINCKMCNQTCIFDCSLLVRFFWYFVVFLEKCGSFVCWLYCCCLCCSCCRCCSCSWCCSRFRCCSRSRCSCKLPFCCYIKCLQKCLGCTCYCSFAHHDKEYGIYSKNNRNTIQNVQNIKDQSVCEIQNHEEKLQMEEEKRILMDQMNKICDNISKHAESIKTTAILYEDPEEMEEIVRKYKKRH